MTLTLTIADNTEGQRILDGLCSATNYNPASGVTKAAWVKEKLIAYLKQFAIRGEFKTTADTIKTAIDGIVIT
jgi:hypothetical protein